MEKIKYIEILESVHCHFKAICAIKGVSMQEHATVALLNWDDLFSACMDGLETGNWQRVAGIIHKLNEEE